MIYELRVMTILLTGVYFIFLFPPSADDASWTGSSLNLSTHNGSIKLWFIEEAVESEGRGFWSKLFGA